MQQYAVNGQIWAIEKIDGEGIPIVILHGWSRTHREWMPIAQALFQDTGRPIYVVDLPGFGSSSLPHVSTIEEYTQLFVHLLAYLSFNKATIIGHSLGGRVGIVQSATTPRLVHRLVLIDPAGVKPFSIRRILISRVASLFRFVPKNLRRLIIDPLMDEDYRRSPELASLYRAVVGRDLRSYLPRITCPVSVIWGERDPILPLALTRIYRKLLPDSTIRVVWGAGHDPHLTHTAQLVRILQEIDL